METFIKKYDFRRVTRSHHLFGKLPKLVWITSMCGSMKLLVEKKQMNLVVMMMNGCPVKPNIYNVAIKWSPKKVEKKPRTNLRKGA